MKCGICLITRLTPVEYIKEWIDWYLVSIGFDKIWIYDGNDSDEISDLCKNNTHVSVIKWPGRYNQLSAYQDFLIKQKSGEYEKMDWVVNFDDDEFLMIEDSSLRIKDILSKHSSDSLGVNLLFYGSSDFDKKPGDSQIDFFTKRTPVTYGENSTIKMIARIDKIDSVNEIFVYNVRSLTRDVRGELCTDFRTYTALDKIMWVNHYFTRSKEEFEAKINRGRADYSNAPRRTMKHLEQLDTFCTITDERAKIRKQSVRI